MDRRSFSGFGMGPWGVAGTRVEGIICHVIVVREPLGSDTPPVLRPKQTAGNYREKSKLCVCSVCVCVCVCVCAVCVSAEEVRVSDSLCCGGSQAFCSLGACFRAPWSWGPGHPLPCPLSLSDDPAWKRKRHTHTHTRAHTHRLSVR